MPDPLQLRTAAATALAVALLAGCTATVAGSPSPVDGGAAPGTVITREYGPEIVTTPAQDAEFLRDFRPMTPRLWVAPDGRVLPLPPTSDADAMWEGRRACGFMVRDHWSSANAYAASTVGPGAPGVLPIVLAFVRAARRDYCPGVPP